MKTKSLALITLICSLLIFNACTQNPCGNSKAVFLSNFSDFVKDVKDTDRKYSDKEWEDLDRKFRKFTDECYPEYEEKMTGDEKGEFFKEAMAYGWQRYGKGVINQITSEEGGLSDEFLKDLEEGLKDGGKDLGEAFKEIGKTFENIDTKKLEEVLENVGKDLEENLKDLEKALDKKEDN